MDGTDDPRHRAGVWGWSLLVGLAFAVVLATWVIGMPKAAAPDEPAHVIKAFATAHGEWLGDLVPGRSPLNRDMHAPPDLVNAPATACFAFQPEQPASCVPILDDPTLQPVESGVSTYPPLYYGVVGGIARIAGAAHDLRIYRAISALFAAAVLALAARTMSRVARGAPLLLVLGLTPMAVFMCMAVNPTSVEITGTLLLAALMASWLAAPRRPGPRQWWWASVAAAIIVLVRPVSLAWVVLIVGAYFVLERRPIGRPPAKRWVAAGSVPVLVAIVASAAWSRYAGVGLVDDKFVIPGSVWDTVRLALGHTAELFSQTIGVLGWLDTKLPFPAFALAVVAIVGVGVLVAVFGDRRLRIVALATTATWILYPAVYTTLAQTPLNWQGRYNLPMLGVVVLVAAQLLTRHLPARVVRGGLAALGAGFVVVEVLAFHQTLRRFMVGAHGNISLHPHAWTPSINAWVLIAANAIAASALVVLLRRSPWPAATAAPTPDIVAGQELSTSKPSEIATGIWAGSNVT